MRKKENLLDFHAPLSSLLTRRKAEGDRVEMRKRLEDETNKRTREQNNNHHVAEKIATLEKERRELSERLKKDSEAAEKLKKANTELSVARAAAQSAASDLEDRWVGGADCCEREMMALVFVVFLPLLPTKV